MAAKNNEAIERKDDGIPLPVSVQASASRNYRTPAKRWIGNLDLIRGRNFNDDKDRGNENYYR